jgi:transcription termination factor Rho
VQLLASTSSARLARTYNLVLAKQNLTLDNAIRDIKLKPSKRLIGRARKFSVRIVVTPTDAAGNCGKAVTKTVKVKR